MDRVVEPELMDDALAVSAYARADFSESNEAFVGYLVSTWGPRLGRVIDLGCGPGAVPILLAGRTIDTHITAVDGAAEMIKVAEREVRTAGLQERIAPTCVRIPSGALPAEAFDVVLSKDMLHHLPDPGVLWREVTRLVKPGGAVCVMDLIRPDSPEAARAIVERVTGREHPQLKEDFYNSLCAAFTIEEVRAQLAAARLDLEVDRTSDRHMRIYGRQGQPHGTGSKREHDA